MIAIIIKRNECYYDYNDRVIIDSISNWDEVSDEDYTLLYKAKNKLGTFDIIERPINEPQFIAKTIAAYLKIAAEEAEKERKEKEKKKRVALERKHKKELKDRESKIKLLKSLQEELGKELGEDKV